MLRYGFVILGAVVGCSSGEGGLASGGEECDSIASQICARWAAEEPASGKPCDPPQITGTTDYTAACEKADERCTYPAASISCPGPG
jgi:hypothetical protein